MPKVKAGTLKPAIDQMKATIREKTESMSELERRGANHRLKRMQRKARRIRADEDRRAALTAKKSAAAESGEAAKPAADAPAEAPAETPAEAAAPEEAAPES